jgi:hypothetical protein
MGNKFTLEYLTEGIQQRDMSALAGRLCEKWNRTGLLRGLSGVNKENMARLLENQAAEVLREANSLSTGAGALTSSGDVRGFSNIAFPIVRRVFGGLIANELVSIQPMSLPSGLLFYLDYTYGTNVGGDTTLSTGAAGSANAQTYTAGRSIYNQPTGKGVRSGSLAVGGQYDLVGHGYSKVHQTTTGNELCCVASGAWAGTSTLVSQAVLFATGTDGQNIMFDAQLTQLIEADAENGSLDNTGRFQFLFFNLNQLGSDFDPVDVTSFALFSAEPSAVGLGVVPQTIQGGGANILNVRRLNRLGTYSAGVFTPNALVGVSDANAVLMAVVTGAYSAAGQGAISTTAAVGLTASYAITAGINVDSSDGSTLTIPAFESNFSTSAPSPIIPEIDIKIESIAVTASTRKLRARWSPELAQDLNAYHSLDAEVELTQILSEQIALEIDREILSDLLREANGANLYWSRAPGKFVNKLTGKEVTLSSTLAPGPTFQGTVREWYETLVETIIDCANTIHRKTLRGAANFIVTSPDVATILEASVAWRPLLSIDANGQVANPFTLGAEPVGTLNNRFTVYKDPYFPQNKVLVGYKGKNYLETGYVYAPYVPLIVTPTIFAPEDFTPRKGVMTRYGKKMVRSDFYGTVVVMDMNII